MINIYQKEWINIEIKIKINMLLINRLIALPAFKGSFRDSNIFFLSECIAQYKYHEEIDFQFVS